MIEGLGLLTAVLLVMGTIGSLIASYTRGLRSENTRLHDENDQLRIMVSQAHPVPHYQGYAARHLAPYPHDALAGADAPLPAYQEETP